MLRLAPITACSIIPKVQNTDSGSFKKMGIRINWSRFAISTSRRRSSLNDRLDNLLKRIQSSRKNSFVLRRNASQASGLLELVSENYLPTAEMLLKPMYDPSERAFAEHVFREHRARIASVIDHLGQQPDNPARCLLALRNLVSVEMNYRPLIPGLKMVCVILTFVESK